MTFRWSWALKSRKQGCSNWPKAGSKLAMWLCLFVQSEFYASMYATISLNVSSTQERKKKSRPINFCPRPRAIRCRGSTSSFLVALYVHVISKPCRRVIGCILQSCYLCSTVRLLKIYPRTHPRNLANSSPTRNIWTLSCAFSFVLVINNRGRPPMRVCWHVDTSVLRGERARLIFAWFAISTALDMTRNITKKTS